MSRAVQDAVLDVDEHGTVAAAGTGGGAEAISMPVHVTVDRPYLLLVQDTATRTPLFLARIADPTAG